MMMPDAIILKCREQINLAGLGNTSCGRSLLFCPTEERCLRRAWQADQLPQCGFQLRK